MNPITVRTLLAILFGLATAAVGCDDAGEEGRTEMADGVATATHPVASVPPGAHDAGAEAEPSAPAPAPAAEPTPPAPPTAAETTQAYADVLTEVITSDGLVRYDLLGTAAIEAKLHAVVRGLAEGPRPVNDGERLALWCNAYNANVLAFALEASRKPGFTSVKDVPGFFDRRTLVVAGETLTLNDLENERVRTLGDARIHAALVCAAMSCPPLRNEPYSGARIQQQLGEQCQRWVNDTTKFRVIDGELGVSRILEWYAPDFARAPYSGPAGFVLAYADPRGRLARHIVGADRVKVRWLDYDWSLNRAAAEKSP